MVKYVHGYSPRETQRLREQSDILADLLHSGIAYPVGSRVLEAGCGVGGQTAALIRRNPAAQFISVDVSADSIEEARRNPALRGAANVRFEVADITALPYAKETFDHVFVCFVLEHLDDPLGALQELKRVLKRGGSITVIEGDHGSCFWHPETEESLKVWRSLIAVQGLLGHDPLIGRGLYPLLREAGFEVKDVAPCWVYADGRNAPLLDGVVNKIIVPMVETARERAIELGIVDRPTWQKGIADLERSGRPPDGTFFYTWFKAVGIKG